MTAVPQRKRWRTLLSWILATGLICGLVAVCFWLLTGPYFEVVPTWLWAGALAVSTATIACRWIATAVQERADRCWSEQEELDRLAVQQFRSREEDGIGTGEDAGE